MVLGHISATALSIATSKSLTSLGFKNISVSIRFYANNCNNFKYTYVDLFGNKQNTKGTEYLFLYTCTKLKRSCPYIRFEENTVTHESTTIFLCLFFISKTPSSLFDSGVTALINLSKTSACDFGSGGKNLLAYQKVFSLMRSRSSDTISLAKLLFRSSLRIVFDDHSTKLSTALLFTLLFVFEYSLL